MIPSVLKEFDHIFSTVLELVQNRLFYCSCSEGIYPRYPDYPLSLGNKLLLGFSGFCRVLAIHSRWPQQKVSHKCRSFKHEEISAMAGSFQKSHKAYYKAYAHKP